MRSYALTDLEALSGLSRRTISDYVSKGLLTGPSHRGRGARYSQRDLDALLIIPRLRMQLREEFPSLAAIRAYFQELAPGDLHRLAGLANDAAFELEARFLRVRLRLHRWLPTVPPEYLGEALRRLTPEQIRGADRGRLNLASLIDLDDIAAQDHLSQSGRFRALARQAAAAAVPSDALTPPVPASDEWEVFADDTIRIRIDKSAMRDDESRRQIPDAIRDLATRLETLLK